MSVRDEEVIDLLPFVREGLIKDGRDRREQYSSMATATTRTTTIIAMVTFCRTIVRGSVEDYRIWKIAAFLLTSGVFNHRGHRDPAQYPTITQS